MKSPEGLLNRLKEWTGLSLLILAVLHSAIPAGAQIETGYQGFGAETLGGQGKASYRVSHLNDSGPGSLRDALSQGDRHIVFDLGGEILLKSDLSVQGANVTLDGFTAPDPGITLKNYGLSINGERGAHDVIVRGIRVRGAGNSADTRETDGLNIIKGAYNVVIDHVSIHGSEDGNLDIGTGAHDVTVSWSILAEPQDHQKNMLIKYNPSRVSLHHNIFVRARQRNPHVAIENAGTPATDTTLDMRNNVIWDWAGGYGTQIAYGPRANLINNFYSNPSGSALDKAQAIIVCKGECDGGNPASAARAYVSGNHSADGVNLNAKGTETTSFPAPPVDTTDACSAAQQVLADAGASVRDLVDQQYLSVISLLSCEAMGGSILEAYPRQVNFSSTLGGAKPSPKALTITDANGGGLAWTATTDRAWLSVSPASGTTPSSAAVAVDFSGLTEASYRGSIRIAAPSGTGSPLEVPVTLTVLPAPIPPEITNPSPGSVLPGSSVTFQWNANGAKVSDWRLYAGSTRAARDLYDSGTFGGGSTTSKVVSGLPTDGRTIWVQLRFRSRTAGWQSADFQYAAALK